jgi:hypothetical protein
LAPQVTEPPTGQTVTFGSSLADHIADIRNMVGIGSGAQREVEDWALSR